MVACTLWEPPSLCYPDIKSSPTPPYMIFKWPFHTICPWLKGYGFIVLFNRWPCVADSSGMHWGCDSSEWLYTARSIMGRQWSVLEKRHGWSALLQWVGAYINVGWLLMYVLATSKVISGWVLTCDSRHSWWLWSGTVLNCTDTDWNFKLSRYRLESSKWKKGTNLSRGQFGIPICTRIDWNSKLSLRQIPILNWPYWYCVQWLNILECFTPSLKMFGPW